MNCFLEKLAEISKQCKHIMLQNEIEKLIQKYKPHSIRKNHHPGNIRKEPKSVKITNIETGEITTYPSIYQAGRALNVPFRIITYHNGTIYKDKYVFKVL